MPKLKDLTGERFGRLTVLKRAGTNSSRKPVWECLCDCGNSKNIVSQSLLNGTTKSCGCLRKEQLSKRLRTHGMRKTRFYDIWYAMKRRCHDENSINYIYYGGRGIKVCDRWELFENFMDDMYESYIDHVREHGENQTTLDRVDPDGNYSPENTRWSTYTTQNRNTRTRSDNKTGYRGVFQINDSKYVSYIKVNKQQVNLGTFDKLEDAVAARKEAESVYW